MRCKFKPCGQLEAGKIVRHRHHAAISDSASKESLQLRSEGAVTGSSQQRARLPVPLGLKPLKFHSSELNRFTNLFVI